MILDKFRLPYRDNIPVSLFFLLALVVPFAFYMGTYEKFEIIKLSLWSFIIGCVLFFYFKKVKNGNEDRVQVHPFSFWMLVLLNGIFILSAFFGLDRINSFLGYYPRFTGSVLFFLLWSITLVLEIILFSKEKFQTLLKFIIFTGFVGAVVGLAQSMGVGFYDGLQTGFFLRAPGLLGNPNFSSLYCVAVFPLSFMFALRESRLQSKLYYGITAFFCVLVTIALSSRGAWFGLLVELCVMVLGFLVLKFSKKFIVSVCIVLCLSGLLGYFFVEQVRPQTIQSTLQLSETNVNLRFFVWDIARSTMQKYPLLGVGPGNFQLSFEQFRDKSLASQNGVYDDAHNLFLQLGATAGIPFLLIFLVFISYVLGGSLKRIFAHKDQIEFALFVGLVGFLVMTCFTPVPTSCWFLLSILIAGLIIPATVEKQGSAPQVLQWLGVLFGCFYALFGILFLSSELFFYKGYVAYLEGRYVQSMRLMNVVKTINPSNSMAQLYRTGNMIRLGYPQRDIDTEIHKITSVHAHDARTYAWVANLYFLDYNITNNITLLEKALEYGRLMVAKDPYYARRIMQYATFLFTDNKLPESLEIAKYSLSLDSDNVPGWLMVARIYQLQNKRDQAIWALEKVYTSHPEIKALKFILQQAKEEKDFKKVFIPVAVSEGALE